MFFSASGSLTAGTEINMDMGRSVLGGVLQFLMPLQSLVHVPGLRYVKRNPLSVFGLFSIDVIAWRGRQRRVNGIDHILILMPRLATPANESRICAPRLLAVSEQFAYKAHLSLIIALINTFVNLGKPAQGRRIFHLRTAPQLLDTATAAHSSSRVQPRPPEVPWKKPCQRGMVSAPCGSH